MKKNLFRTGVLLSTAALLLASAGLKVSATTYTWNGAGTDGSYTTAGNWAGGVAPGSADSGYFNNNTNTSVNLAANANIGSLTFDSTSLGSFTFGGATFSAVASGGGISINNTVTTSPTETFNNNILLFSGRANGASFTVANNSLTAGLVFNGNITGGGITSGISLGLSFRGPNSAGLVSNTTVNGIIGDGTGGGSVYLFKTGGTNQNGTLTLNGANTYSGGTDFGGGSGSIVVGNASALGTGALRLYGGSGTLFSANTSLTGANAIANTVNFASGTGTSTTTTAAVTFTVGSNVGTLTGGVAPAVGDIITSGSANLAQNARVTAVSGTTPGSTITFDSNALVSGSTTLTTAPFVGPGGGTFNIGGSNNLQLSGNENLTTIYGTGAGGATATYNVTNTGTTTISGKLQEQNGSAGVTKTGAGTLILSGANTYTGSTNVTGGTLLINNTSGSGTGSSGLITVSTGATFGGSGSISGLIQVNSGGFFTPGGAGTGSTALFTSTSTGNSALVLNTGSTSIFDINGLTLGTNYDSFSTSGRVNYGGDLKLNLGAALTNGTNLYDLFTFASVGGTSFNTVSITGLQTLSLANSSGVWSGTDGSGDTYSFSQSTGFLTINAVPEPSAFWLLLAGGLVVLGARRRHLRQD